MVLDFRGVASLGGGANDFNTLVGGAQRLERQRLGNAFAAEQLDMTREARARRQKLQRLMQRQENMPRVIEQLKRDGFHVEANELALQQQRIVQGNIQALEGLQGQVRDAAAYERMRSGLIKMGIPETFLPTKWDSSYFANEIKRQRGIQQKMTNVSRVDEQGRVFQREVFTNALGEQRRGPEFMSNLDRQAQVSLDAARMRAAQAPESFELKSSDFRNIERSVMTTLATMTANGEFVFGEGEEDRRDFARRVVNDAEKIMKISGGQVGWGEAINQAFDLQPEREDRPKLSQRFNPARITESPRQPGAQTVPARPAVPTQPDPFRFRGTIGPDVANIR